MTTRSKAIGSSNLEGNSGEVALADRAPVRHAPVRVNWPSAGAADSIARRYGMDDQNLSVRRQFIRLDEEDRAILADLAPWAQEVAPDLARDFYDWQFDFSPTRQFFEHIAAERGMPLNTLRTHLEAAQASYFTEVFAGALIDWDSRYFEKRLHVGTTHDRINLPFKW